MLTTIKNLGRAIIPAFIFKALQPVYHGAMAQFAAIYFGNPSSKLFVIGVTGTAGKSTTVIMTAHILNSARKKTGYITTAGSYNGNTKTTNKHGLSMPGGWMLQKQLADMVSNKCEYAIVECTSEGLAQNRHLGIHFRTALFTNLSPAHIDSHGSFDNYRAAKGKLFATLQGNTGTILGANLDDPNKNFFLSFPAAQKFGVSMRSDLPKTNDFPCLLAEQIAVTDYISFLANGVHFTLHLFGTFNITNALLATAFAQTQGVTLQDAAQSLLHLGTVPGRMEVIPAPNGARIVVDYAPEPAAMEASLRAMILLSPEKIIHVFGSTGGHRDVAKRFEFGEISSQFADTIIITNDDVYDSDPEEIARNVQEGIERIAQKKVSHIETILDRKIAIGKAISLAGTNDVVLITGKGSEQFLVLPGNERIAWDERAIVKELLQKNK